MNASIPEKVIAHQTSRQLELHYQDGSRTSLSYEYLRVYSPSAEVRGHGDNPGVLQVGKREVEVVRLEPVGQYALKLIFSDGHDSGIYSWNYFYELGEHYTENWETYLARLAAVGASRG